MENTGRGKRGPCRPFKRASLESAGAVGSPIPSRAVIAGLSGAEIGTAAAAIGACGDVIQRTDVGIDTVRPIRSVASHAIDAANERGRDAGSAEHQPGRVAPA